MVRHVVMWQLRDELTAEEKEKVKREIRDGLEGLVGIVPGVVKAQVLTEVLGTSNADLMLDCLAEGETELKEYGQHPLHRAVIEEKILPFVRSRICMDYEI